MSPSVFEPRRLREGPARPDSVEGRLARQLRLLSAYSPMPQLRRYSALPRRRRRILMTVRIAGVAAIVLAASGVATATATYVVRRVWSGPAAVGARASGEAERSHRGSAGKRGPEARREPVEAAAPLRREPAAEAVASAKLATASPITPAPPRSPSLRPRLARNTDGLAAQPHRPPAEIPPAPAQTIEPPALPRPPATAVVPPPLGRPISTVSPGPSGRGPAYVRVDGVSQEAGLLRQALSALRRDHDAKRALALLDDYDQRFGQGTLAPEATSARAQALLQLGDNARALEILDRLPLWDQGYTGELRVIRGELRSLSGRCREALLDFDAVVRAGKAADEVARALYGRASCRARLGDLSGAQEDRQRYLKQFPQGPAAKQLSSPP